MTILDQAQARALPWPDVSPAPADADRAGETMPQARFWREAICPPVPCPDCGRILRARSDSSGRAHYVCPGCGRSEFWLEETPSAGMMPIWPPERRVEIAERPEPDRSAELRRRAEILRTWGRERLLQAQINYALTGQPAQWPRLSPPLRAAGAPRNPDGTLNLVHYAAWLNAKLKEDWGGIA